MLRWLPRLNQETIAQKIIVGYTLSIGLAIAGTGIGLTLGSLSETRAVQRYQVSQEQALLINRLKSSTQNLFRHPDRLLATAGNPLWRRYEIGQYSSDVTLLRQVIDELSQLATDSAVEPSPKLAKLIRDLPQFLTDYTVWSEAQWRLLDEQPDSFAQELAERMAEPEWNTLQARFQHLSEDFERLRNEAEAQRDDASMRWAQARRLRLWMIVSSMSLATLLAIGLALCISRTIAGPIQDLTSITQYITQHADFDQRVTVGNNDETGQLAESIDRLVQWVRQYTNELQDARDTLEERVEERTRTLQKAQAQLVQQEKMSSLGQLVAGVAHEINNPVGFIYGNLGHVRDYVTDLLRLIELYQAHYPDPPPTIADEIENMELEFIAEDLPKLLYSMHTGADRIKEIVLSLRTFSRLDESQVKDADLHAGIDSTLMILAHRLKAQSSRQEIVVVRDYGDLPLVNCHAGQLNQVFMNLLTNAIDAIEDDLAAGTLTEPRITISTRITQQSCTIEVQNNGTPIPPGIKERIFNPFFTTKPVGKGTGMGLAISYQIVAEKHGGQLACDSDRSGTRFTITLPLKAAIAARSA